LEGGFVKAWYSHHHLLVWLHFRKSESCSALWGTHLLGPSL